MSWWQWVLYGLLLVVALCQFDGIWRSSLDGGAKVAKQQGTRDSDMLIIHLPGLLADGEWSVRALTDTWRSYGDVWLVNPTGDRFEDQALADDVAEMLEQDDHMYVVFIGSSLGAFNALDVMNRLSRDKRAQTHFDLVAVCTPGEGVRYIKQPLRAMSGVAKVFRFGPGTNATWGKLFTRSITGKQPRTFAMTYYVDQVNYVRSRPEPKTLLPGGVRVVYVQAEEDELISSEAASQWTVDVVTVPGVKHVSYEADPDEWTRVFDDVLSRLGRY